MSGEASGWDALATIEGSQADVVVEVTPTNLETGEPATSHVKAAIDRGLSVTTTNKGPVALRGKELVAAADTKGVRFLFEGTVMSGTPVMSYARRNLLGSTIESVQGIFNGTTNYILTEMESGSSYAAALAEAQKLGYAETIPDADVEGHDALAKVIILANMVLGADLTPADVPCKGITDITSEQVEEARGRGTRYKLIGRAVRTASGCEASVAPVALPLNDPLAGVSGATNAITFQTDCLGSVTVVGPGAGRGETGFALLSDLLEIAHS